MFVLPMGEDPVETPLEHWERVIDRERIERRNAVDDELHLRTAESAPTCNRQHSDVDVGEIRCISKRVIAIQTVQLFRENPQ